MNKLRKAAVKSSSTSTNSQNNQGANRLSLGRISKDYSDYLQEDIPQCKLEQSKESPFIFSLDISPDTGIYIGGTWNFTIDCTNDYPNRPPAVKCNTVIYHPNIDLQGHVCLSYLRLTEGGWSPVSTITHLVFGLLSLFLEPNAMDPLNPAAGQHMSRDIDDFKRTVQKTMKGGYFFDTDFKKVTKY